MTTDASRSTQALQARELYRFFHSGDDETLALRGVSLDLDRGSILAIRGPSGSGKSTLLQCLGGLDEPDGGIVDVAGERMSHRSEIERCRIRARRVGILLQSGNLLSHLTIGANVAMARHAARGRRPTTPLTDLLAQVGLAERASSHPAMLSGGELARAGLAVAMANDPDVLLADEPTGELDGETEQEILHLLADRAERGCAVVVVTHSEAVASIADRLVTLSDGRVVS